MAHRDHPANDYRAVVVPTAQLVDVREPAEVAAGTLPDAANIPLGELRQRVTELNKNRRVVLLCRSGGRSTTAAQYLTANGFADVVNLAGGMLAISNGD